MSHLSTTSEGEQAINSTYNNYYLYQSFPENEAATINNINKYKDENKNININKKRDILESIIIGIKDISDCINSNKTNIITFDCYYFGDIYLNEEEKICFDNNIKKAFNDFKKNKKDKYNELFLYFYKDA